MGLRLWGALETSYTGRLSSGESPLPLRNYDAPRPDSLRLNQVQLTLDRPYDNTQELRLRRALRPAVRRRRQIDARGGPGRPYRRAGQRRFPVGGPAPGVRATLVQDRQGKRTGDHARKVPRTGRQRVGRGDEQPALFPQRHLHLPRADDPHRRHGEVHLQFSVLRLLRRRGGLGRGRGQQHRRDLHRRRRLVEPGAGRRPRADAGAPEHHHRPRADRRQQRLSDADGHRDQSKLDREADRIAEFRLAGRGERSGHPSQAGRRLRRGALPDVHLQRLCQRHVAAGGDARRRRLADRRERRSLREHGRGEPDAGAEAMRS